VVKSLSKGGWYSFTPPPEELDAKPVLQKWSFRANKL